MTADRWRKESMLSAKCEGQTLREEFFAANMLILTKMFDSLSKNLWF